MVTACTDSVVRFWRVKMVEEAADDDSNGEQEGTKNKFAWEEWQMESAHGDSSIKVSGRPVSVSAAYSGRIAVAYQTGASYQKKQQQQQAVPPDSKQRYVNLSVDIYECESTGGSEWLREDTIALRNIELQPEMPAVDLSGLVSKDLPLSGGSSFKYFFLCRAWRLATGGRVRRT